MKNMKKILSFFMLVTCLYSNLLISTAHAMRFESNIPDVGQEGQFTITNETERAIGKVLMHKIYSTDFVSTDAVVQEYLRELGTRLSKGCPPCDFKMFYFPLNSHVLNAFAFFGGNVAVHTGLIYALENESELAGVLAHETAHVTQRHLARMLTNQKKMTPITIAQILLSAAIGALGAPDVGIGLLTAAMGSQVQQMINYTREHEYEADRIGIQILSRAGFDPMALPGVFKKLSEQQRYSETPPEYFLTHPLFENRIADAYNRAEKMPRVTHRDSLFFQLVRARIEASSTEKNELLLRRTQERLKSGKFTITNRTFAEYAHALALTKSRKYSEARNIVQNLIEEHGDQEELWILKLSKAEIEQEAGNPQEAASLLGALSEEYPGHPAIFLQYADTLMELKQYDKAKQALLRLNPKRAEDPNIYHALVKANSKLGRVVDAHRAQAEWLFLRGEYKKAEQQLDWAMEKAGTNTRLVEEIRFRKAAVTEWIKRQKELKL